jgi:hypothetical protein
VEAINEAAKEVDPTAHYDDTQEVRAKGAGFYRFSGDEETRQKQLEELKKLRTETEQTREELGIEPEQGAGGSQEATQTKPPKVLGRAMQKRKRELEERRKLVDAKRRKATGADEAEGKAADDFLANLESDLIGKGRQ